MGITSQYDRPRQIITVIEQAAPFVVTLTTYHTLGMGHNHPRTYPPIQGPPAKKPVHQQLVITMRHRETLHFSWRILQIDLQMVHLGLPPLAAVNKTHPDTVIKGQFKRGGLITRPKGDLLKPFLSDG